MTPFARTHACFGFAALGVRDRAQDGVATGVEQRFTAGHRLAEGRPAFGPQIVTGEFQSMLQFANVGLIERKRVPENCGRVFHGIALGQGGPAGRGSNADQREADQGSKDGVQTLMDQGGTPVLTRLWHSRIVR